MLVLIGSASVILKLADSTKAIPMFAGSTITPGKTQYSAEYSIVLTIFLFLYENMCYGTQ